MTAHRLAASPAICWLAMVLSKFEKIYLASEQPKLTVFVKPMFDLPGIGLIGRFACSHGTLPSFTLKSQVKAG
jgi:hypothetical protein